MTSHVSGEEAVGAIFDCSSGKAKPDEDANKGPFDHSNKKKNQKGHGGLLMAAAERKAGRLPAEGIPDHFDKLLEGPCPNHTFPVKPMYKDCSLMKQKKPEDEADDAGEKDGNFSLLDGYLMIFGGLEAYGSKR